MYFTKSTLHCSPVVTFVVVFVLLHKSFAQYGSGGGGGGRKGQSTLSLPLEMIFNQPSMSEPKAYQMMAVTPMRGGGGGGGGGYGSTKKGNFNNKKMSPNRSNSVNYSQPPTQQSQPTMPIRAAVQSTHTVDYREVPSQPSNIKPQTILVEAQAIPLNILFQSKSSELNLQAEHIPSKGSSQETKSEDEPHHLMHTVTKPIIQEVYEIITPYRKITQEIKPVHEEIQTIVARNAKDNKYEPVNGGKLSQPTQSPSEPHSQQTYSENEFAEMMKALKMEMPKSYLGYQPAKQSRMQMYMSQMGEHSNQNAHQRESEMTNKQESQESLPLVEMTEPENKEEIVSSTPITIEEMALVEEKEAVPEEAITQASSQTEREKAMHSLMFLATGSGKLANNQQQQQQQQQQAVKLTTSKVFAQTNNYAESHSEPTGY